MLSRSAANGSRQTGLPACSVVPTGCVDLIAFLAMEVRVNRSGQLKSPQSRDGRAWLRLFEQNSTFVEHNPSV
jgi:hypothetical protein